MENNFYENLEEYLKNNGIEEMPKTKKELYKTLKAVLFNIKVAEDHTDLVYSKGKDTISRDEYLDRLEDINKNYINGIYYKINVRNIIKEERKQKIKAIFRLK